MGRTNFVVISNQRFGSSHFCRLLDSHPEIHCRQELLRNYRETGRDVIEFLDEMFYGSRFPLTTKAFGFKIQHDHMNGDIEKYLKEKNIKIIHFVRRDLLETSLWFKENHIGKTSGGLGPPLILPDGEKITAKIPEVLVTMMRLKSWIKEYNRLADLIVYYSEMGNKTTFENEAVRDSILKLLEVETLPLFSEVNKKNIRPPNEECVVNWNELLDAIEVVDLPVNIKV